KNCFCTAMLYDPKDHYEPEETKENFQQHSKLYERFMRIKKWKLLQPFLKKEKEERKPGGHLKTIMQFFLNL
ncbi:MAG TPA: GNAT family N-acetyltransferase, partial [Agriterribacter sp.]|nr:GNAT family N-acetyltransferase [Agriterribacter sp.]